MFRYVSVDFRCWIAIARHDWSVQQPFLLVSATIGLRLQGTARCLNVRIHLRWLGDQNVPFGNKSHQILGKSSDFPINHINPPPFAEGCWLLGAKVPAGYAFGINENDPVAVGHGIPRCFTAKPNRLEHIKIRWILAGSPTCWLCPLVFHNHSSRLMGD